MPKLAIPLLLLLAACSGTAARENVLMPAMSKAWLVVISSAVVAGVESDGSMTDSEITATHDASAAMQSALDAGDMWSEALTAWPALKMLAVAGLQAQLDTGEIGPGVRSSLMETINQFDTRHTQLLTR